MKLLEVTERSVADLKISYAGADFNVSDWSLTSLKGSPSEVYGFFLCGSNSLTSLRGGPSKVHGSFNCAGNDLVTLDGGPEFVGRNFGCENNFLQSLQGAPKHVGGVFSCRVNKLTSLIGAPAEVASFDCSHNKLTTLEGAPSKVLSDFLCNDNQLTSLKGVHRIIKEMNGIFRCYDNLITEGLEYILLIKGVKEICSDDTAFDKAANDYLDNNPSGSMKAVLDVLEMMEGTQ